MCMREEGKLSIKNGSFFSFSQSHTSIESNELQINTLLEMDFNSGKEDKYRRRNLGIMIGGKALLFTPLVSVPSMISSIEWQFHTSTSSRFWRHDNKSNVSMYLSLWQLWMCRAFNLENTLSVTAPWQSAFKLSSFWRINFSRLGKEFSSAIMMYSKPLQVEMSHSFRSSNFDVLDSLETM